MRKGDLVRIDGQVSLFEDTSADNFRFDHRTIRCDSGDTVLILTDKDEYRSSRLVLHAEHGIRRMLNCDLTGYGEVISEEG